jgi:hypothetical protein
MLYGRVLQPGSEFAEAVCQECARSGLFDRDKISLRLTAHHSAFLQSTYESLLCRPGSVRGVCLSCEPKRKSMARKVGQITARGDRRWLIRVYLGRDHETNKRKYPNRTIHGPMRTVRVRHLCQLPNRKVETFGLRSSYPQESFSSTNDLALVIEGTNMSTNIMVKRIAEGAPRLKARTAGALYLIVIVVASFAEFLRSRSTCRRSRRRGYSGEHSWRASRCTVWVALLC